MFAYKWGLRPLLYAMCGMDAERVHDLAMRMLRQTWAPGVVRQIVPRVQDKRLQQKILGVTFQGAFGLAAGLDKQAEALPALEAFGFSFLTVGGVVPFAQPGNPKPRMFALWEDGAVINRMGFNSPGAAVVAERLRQARVGVPLIVNLGVNKENALDPERALEDYRAGIRMLGTLVDIAEVNVSSPNTDGLRDLVVSLPYIVPILQGDARAKMDRSGRRLQVVYKLSGDMVPELHEKAVGHIVSAGGDSISLINTSVARRGLRSKARDEKGGLSGPPIFMRALETIQRTRALTPARFPLIGIGGVTNAADAIALMEVGANMVAGITGFVAHDPFIAPHVDAGVLEYMERHGMHSITDFQHLWR